MADASPLLKGEEEDETKKQGRKYFGCCCDSRRAVIVLTSFMIICEVTMFSVASALHSVPVTALRIASWIVDVVWNISTIIGAIKFNDIIVLMSAVWHLYMIAASIYLQVKQFASYSTSKLIILSIVYACVLILVRLAIIYANCLFAYEIRKDIMTRDSYSKRERYCCV